MVAGLTLNWPSLCPVAVPLKATLRLGLEAFELIVTLPLKPPADCGAKVTLKDALCPGVKVTGKLRPVRLKPVPEAAACEIVAFTPPVFVTVSVCAWF
jgi:hypothetical protein